MYINQKLAMMSLLSLFLGIGKVDAAEVTQPATRGSPQEVLAKYRAARKQRLDAQVPVKNKPMQYQPKVSQQQDAAELGTASFASLVFNPPSIIVPNIFNTAINPNNPTLFASTDTPPIIVCGINIPLNNPQPIYLTFNVPQNFVSAAGDTQVIVHFVAMGNDNNSTTSQVQLALTSGFTPAGQTLTAATAQSTLVDVSNTSQLMHYSATFVLSNTINPDDLAQLSVARNGGFDNWSGTVYVTSIEFSYATATS